MNEVNNVQPAEPTAPERNIERFVVTLTDEEFAKVQNRDDHVVTKLVLRDFDIEVIIQREADE